MKLNSNQRISSFLLFMVFAFTLFLSIAAAFGVDVVEIYLNDKLLVRNTMDKPLTIKSLNLTEANVNDQLIVRYGECHAPVTGPKGRAISLRDESGNIVKEWKFEDSGDNSSSMTIPVREILQVQKSPGNSLVLFYTSDGLKRVQKIASL